jgi:hypothetical protein
MSIPFSNLLKSKKSLKGVPEIDEFLTGLVKDVREDYEELSKGISGEIRGSCFTQKQQWIPTLAGSTNEGVFTYTRQIAWIYRQGLIVDVWADVEWTNEGGATGSLYAKLPYMVTNSDGLPFQTAVQTSIFAYGAGHTSIFMLAEPDSYKGYFWGSGTGVATAQLAVPHAGRVIFNIRYLGVQDER